MKKLTLTFFYPSIMLMMGISVCALLSVGLVSADPAAGRPKTVAAVQLAQKDVTSQQFNQAIGVLSAALARASGAHDRLLIQTQIASIYRLWGKNCLDAANFPAALGKFQESVALAVKTSNVKLQEQDFRDIGTSYDYSGQYDRALQFDQRAVSLAVKIGDTEGQEIDLGNIGGVYQDLHLYDTELAFLQQALALELKIGDTEGQEITLGSIGVVHKDLGQYDKALQFEQRSVALAAKIGDTSGEETEFGDVGELYDDLGIYDKALAFYQQALSLATKNSDGVMEEHSLCNIGPIYDTLGQFDKALQFYQRSLALAIKNGDVEGREYILTNIGKMCQELGQYDNAMNYCQQALTIATKYCDTNRQGTDLAAIGDIYMDLGQYAKALYFEQKALALAFKTRDTNVEELGLNRMGVICKHLHQYDKALNYFKQAQLIQLQIGGPFSEATDLYNLMGIEQSLGRPSLAIYYGKQSVNIYQTIRAGVANIDAAAQESYLSTLETTYRQLGDLLVSQGRLPEAEQILGLMKEQEFFQYIHPDMQVAPKDAAAYKPVDMTPRETKWNRRIRQAEQTLASLEAQLAPFEGEGDRSPANNTQKDALVKILASRASAYQQTMSEAAADFPATPQPDDRLASTQLAQDAVQRLTAGTALVYTIVGDTNITEIIVTPAQKPGQVGSTVVRQSPPISSEDLYKQVADFRIALTHPDLDPRPLGKTFYNLLIAPIKTDLDQAQTKTILFSLDDALRYVPIAALVDPAGDYIVQHYKTATVTLLDTGSGMSGIPSDQTQILGLGTSAACTVGNDQFPALPGVTEELKGIVQEPGETNGVAPGIRLMDAQFTQAALAQNLAIHKYNIVHIASHFAINTTDTNSFLLLGDGTAESVSDLRKVPNRFAGVDLLTLSACDTNEDIQTHNGHEVDGFGALMQQLGAKSVIASLWPVSDAVTPALMQALYQYRVQNPTALTADSLRYAQLTLLTGSPTVASSLARRGPLTTRDSKALPTAPTADFPAYARNPAAPYAHPYYWAPFVLIGDWK